jgi:hypothetical protein
LSVAVSYVDPDVSSETVWLQFDYDPDLRMLLNTVAPPDFFWGASSGIPLGPLSSVVHRINCDSG